MRRPDFNKALLAWYLKNAREMPWRSSRDPYAIWVSEIMLQQTRVETVIPYYQRWMRRFPNINALASASQKDVLTAWEGLGYYSRARNLHRAAQIVQSDMGGQLPKDPGTLRKLPGIGPYSAGAIASIAFNLDEVALDGNVRRVLARVFNITLPARSQAGERRLHELAETHLPAGEAGAYNQALMDLGAAVCTPRTPNCPVCPLADGCQARTLGVQEYRPVLEPRPAIPHHTVTAAVITHGSRVLIAQRPLDGLLGGLWEFPGGKRQSGEDLTSCLQREICEELGVDIHVGVPIGVYQHAFTHFKITLHAFCCTIKNNSHPQAIQVNALHWVNPVELPNFPMGKIDRQISRQILQNDGATC